MNKTSLWIVVVTALWIGFLMGYAVSAHTGGAKGDAGAASSKDGGGASAGGYGK